MKIMLKMALKGQTEDLKHAGEHPSCDILEKSHSHPFSQSTSCLVYPQPPKFAALLPSVASPLLGQNESELSMHSRQRKKKEQSLLYGTQRACMKALKWRLWGHCGEMDRDGWTERGRKNQTDGTH